MIADRYTYGSDMSAENLSKAQEAALIARAQQGDLRARDELMVAFLPLARTSASYAGRKYQLDADDLTQDASIAVIEAIDRFEAARGLRFSTFLMSRFRGIFTAAHRNEQHVQVTMSWYQSDAEWFKNAPRRLSSRRLSSQAVSNYWPQGAIDFVKQLKRRNDRLIAKGLWLDAPPRLAADIARRLGISRSAVTQRRNKICNVLQQKYGKLVFDQYVNPPSLNSFWDDDI